MVMVTGYENTVCIRAFALLYGLRSEIDYNMKLTSKQPSSYTLIKRELGFKGNREKVYDLYKEYLKESLRSVINPRNLKRNRL